MLEAHHHHGNFFLVYWNISWAYVRYIIPRIQNLPKSQAHDDNVILAKGSSEPQRDIPVCLEVSSNHSFLPDANPTPTCLQGFQSLSRFSGLRTLRLKAPHQNSELLEEVKHVSEPCQLTLKLTVCLLGRKLSVHEWDGPDMTFCQAVYKGHTHNRKDSAGAIKHTFWRRNAASVLVLLYLLTQ